MRTTEPVVSENYSRPMRIALIAGLVAAVIAAAGLFISGPWVFFQAYLFAFMFWLGISLGSLAILLLHFTTGSKWGLTIRRVVEAGAGSIWSLALLFIPLLFGMPYLFPWARPAEVAVSPMLQAKAFYLNVPFFIGRAIFYFAAWFLLAYFVNRRSASLGKGGADVETVHGQMQGLGAFGLLVYAFSMTFASVDWLMSIQPYWNSTIFGMLTIITQVLTAMSFAILMLNLFPSLSIGRIWGFKKSPIPYRDLGALMLTLVMGWAYLAYFQMLIIWAGNIPREVVWYNTRMQGGWSILAIFITLFQFVVPFFLLLSIRSRYNLRVLAGLSGLLLFTNLVNMFWTVKPAFSPVLSISWLDIVLPVAIGGLWLAAFFYTLKRRPVLSAVDQEVLKVEPAAEKALPQH